MELCGEQVKFMAGWKTIWSVYWFVGFYERKSIGKCNRNPLDALKLTWDSNFPLKKWKNFVTVLDALCLKWLIDKITRRPYPFQILVNFPTFHKANLPRRLNFSLKNIEWKRPKRSTSIFLHPLLTYNLKVFKTNLQLT